MIKNQSYSKLTKKWKKSCIYHSSARENVQPSCSYQWTGHNKAKETNACKHSNRHKDNITHILQGD